MELTLRTVNAVISALFFICYTYQFFYIPLVLLKKRQPLPSPAAAHRYAVLIAARNEENVIAGLLDSLKAQTYDMSLVTVFVAADNCTDSTAAIARSHGAVVYERFNHLNVGKGYVQVFQRYGGALLKGTAKGSWSCFDMSMSILPAFILTALCLLANLTLTVLGLLQGDGAWFAASSLLECMGSILATLLVLGGITTASEWRRIHAPAWKKLAYTLTFPLFMLTYLPISMAALFMKVEWKPIRHGVKLTSLPSPAVKN